MDPIFHITTREAWRDATEHGVYRPTSLEKQGFIHFSTASQVVRVANRLFRGQRDLVLLELHPAGRYEVRWEDCYEAGELFPHIYAALRTADVFRVIDLSPGEDGGFCLPVVLRPGPAVHHIAFRTDSVAALSTFYQSAFGLALVRESDGAHWLALGRETVLMIEARRANEPQTDPCSQRLLCMHCDDLGAAEARLTRANIVIEERTSSTIYFRDLEGRRLGLSVHPLEV